MKNPFRNKKQSSVAPIPPESAYYEKVSERFGTVQILLYLSLFVFVVASVLLNTHLITYQNFYLFFKDLNASIELPIGDGEDVLSYQTGDNMGFTLYRGGLAVTSENSVTLFSATGRQTLSQTVSFRNPVSVGKGKYLLVYEQGGYQYALFNSYSQIFEGESEYPIHDAAVSDAGMYALVTSSGSHTSAVTLYSDRFSMINRYQKNGYVTDVAIDPGGKSIALLTVVPKNGFMESEILICRPGKDEAEASATIDVLGWSLAFTDNDRLALLAEDRLTFFNTRGDLLHTHSFENKSVLYADLGEGGVALCLGDAPNQQKKSLFLFDKNGKVLYNEVTQEAVFAISRCEGALYWLTEDAVCRWDQKNKQVQRKAVSTADKHLLAVNREEILLCSSQKAEYIAFHS